MPTKSVKLEFQPGLFGIGGKWIVETSVGNFKTTKSYKNNDEASAAYKDEKKRLGLTYTN